jgi:hypothetical protein
MPRPDTRRTILRILRDVLPYALPAVQLFEEVNRLVRPPLSKVEFAEQLGWLADKNFVGFKPDALAPDEPEARKWSIKEPGEVYLDA